MKTRMTIMIMIMMIRKKMKYLKVTTMFRKKMDPSYQKQTI